MKRNLFTFIILLFAVFSINAQIVEDFEGATFLPDDWSETGISMTYYHSVASDWWTINNQSAGIFQSVGDPEEMLITPLFTYNGTMSEFSYLASGPNGDFGYGSTTVQLKYATDITGPWTDIGASILLDYGVTAQLIDVDISALANGDYYFAFATTSTFDYPGYNSAFALDDVSIVAGATTYTVTFTVDDDATATLLEGALIDIAGGTYTETTDVDGEAAFDLEEGTYTFAVTIDGYDDYNGTYTVTTDAGQTVAVHMTETISVKEVKAAGISIYPNPSNGVFNVNVESNFNLEVLDITGKVVNTQILTGNSTIEINTPGVYFLRFSNEEGSVTQRVIVQ
ncbi:MAG: T9SS type A sorting domain-containing protein [Bacteroidales bacterium]|nr:T9SS type A sorting domain-containing protein [Bacteroidales bacterium]